MILLAGFTLVLVNCSFYVFSEELQLKVFIIGILLLGIPHGAADGLIAKNLGNRNSKFSKGKFNLMYLGNIALYAGFLFFFPITGFIVFLLFSSYHFGESDLNLLNTKSVLGRILVFNYGLLILSVIFLPGFQQMQAYILSLDVNNRFLEVVNWINDNNLEILMVIFILFVINSILYFLTNKITCRKSYILLLQNLILMLILYNLPLLLSFSFYFLLWHSLFSLKSILLYLLKDKTTSISIVAKEIIINSLIATLGIIFFGWAGYGQSGNHNILLYAVLGLAVLTTSHMQIMHQMYDHVKRIKKS